MSRSRRSSLGRRSTAWGALLGTFAGDALGRPWEGAAPAAGEDRVERSLARGRLVYTDDTQLTLALAEHLIEHPEVQPERLRGTILEHFEPGRGYGVGMRQLVSLWRRGVPIAEAATAVFAEGSYGNGAAMRVAPVGVRWSGSRCAEVAARQARLTHVHPLGVAGAVLQATAVARAAGSGRFGPGDLVALAGEDRPDELADELDRVVAVAEGWDAPLAELPIGRGVVAHRSVPAALWCAAVGDGIEEAIGLALALGGDADTIAAMAGAVAGAADPGGLPHRWLEAMEDGPRGRSYAEGLADRLATA